VLQVLADYRQERQIPSAVLAVPCLTVRP